MDVTRNLRNVRLRKGLTQKELGARVGLSQMSISSLELGSRKGPIDVWERLEKALGVSIKRLRAPAEEV